MRQDLTDSKVFHFNNEYWDEPRIFESATIFQMGDLSCNANYTIGEHRQKCYEISYIVSGAGWFSTNGKRFEVKAGDVFINLPEQIHNGKADPANPFRFLYMGFIFNCHPFQEGPFDHIQKMLQKVEIPVMQDQFEIRNPFLQVLDEIYKDDDYYEMMINSYLQQIIIKTYRNFCSNWEHSYTPNQKLEGNQAIIHGVITYIDNNILTINELTQVSRALGYSYSYLSHVFSEETGLTLQAYHSQKRIEKATQMLKAEKLSITNIADRLQYQSIHSFSKAFKKMTGISPAQYQKLQKQKQSKD